MRWGPLLILLLVSTALAVDVVNSGSIGGFVRGSRVFGAPVAVQWDSDSEEEALIWNSAGEVYILHDSESNPELWNDFESTVLGVAGLGQDVVLVEADSLTVWTQNLDKINELSGEFTGPPQVIGSQIFVPSKNGLEVYTKTEHVTTLSGPNAKFSVGDIDGGGKLELASTSEGTIYFFDSSLDLQWTKEIAGKLSRPTIGAFQVAVATSQGELVVLDADGQEVLKKQTDQLSIYADIPAPVFVDDLVILFGPQDTIHAFRGETEAWSTTLNGVDNLRFDPIVAATEILVPAQFTLRVMNLDGIEVETIEMDGNVKTPVLVDLDGGSIKEVLVISESESSIDGQAFVVFETESHKPSIVTVNLSDYPDFLREEVKHTEIRQLKQTLEQFKGLTYNMPDFNKILYSSRIASLMIQADETDELSGDAYAEGLNSLMLEVVRIDQEMGDYLYNSNYQIEVPTDEQFTETGPEDIGPYFFDYAVAANCEKVPEQAHLFDFFGHKVKNPFRSESQCNTVDLVVSIAPVTNDAADARDCVKYCPVAAKAAIKAIFSSVSSYAQMRMDSFLSLFNQDARERNVQKFETAQAAFDRITGGANSFVTAIMNMQSDEVIMDELNQQDLSYYEKKVSFESIKAEQSAEVWNHITVPAGEFLSGPGGNGVICTLSAVGLGTGVGGAILAAHTAGVTLPFTLQADVAVASTKVGFREWIEKVIKEGVEKGTKEGVEDAARLGMRSVTDPILLRKAGYGADTFGRNLLENSDELTLTRKFLTDDEAITFLSKKLPGYSADELRVVHEAIGNRRGFEQATESLAKFDSMTETPILKGLNKHEVIEMHGALVRSGYDTTFLGRLYEANPNIFKHLDELVLDHPDILDFRKLSDHFIAVEKQVPGFSAAEVTSKMADFRSTTGLTPGINREFFQSKLYTNAPAESKAIFWDKFSKAMTREQEVAKMLEDAGLVGKLDGQIDNKKMFKVLDKVAFTANPLSDVDDAFVRFRVSWDGVYDNTRKSITLNIYDDINTNVLRHEINHAQFQAKLDDVLSNLNFERGSISDNLLVAIKEKPVSAFSLETRASSRWLAESHADVASSLQDPSFVDDWLRMNFGSAIDNDRVLTIVEGAKEGDPEAFFNLVYIKTTARKLGISESEEFLKFDTLLEKKGSEKLLSAVTSTSDRQLKLLEDSSIFTAEPFTKEQLSNFEKTISETTIIFNNIK